MTATPRPRRDPYAPFRQQMLSPVRVKELSQLRPGRVVFDVAMCWLFIIAAWSLVAWRTTWWTIAPAMLVIGTRYYALFVVGHDGLHRRLLSSRSANDWFCDLFVLGPIGAITRLNNRNHLGHHQHLATELDPDRHKHGCFNKTDLTELLGYLSGISSIWHSVHNVFFASGRAPKGETSDSGYTARDFGVLVVVQGTLIGGLTWAFGWWGWPLLWAAPVYVFTYLGDSIRSFAEHSHPQADALADEHRLITYVSWPLERMFFAPMNMNYHAAHHLWVSIPYYNLPVADAEMRRHALALPLEECRVRTTTA